MKKKQKQRLLGVLATMVLLLGTVGTTVNAENEIVPSTTEYEVQMSNASRIFIGNEKAVEYEVGRKYFLHYTVSDIESNTTTQSGMIISTDKEEPYPYTKGGLRYDTKSVLLEEGYTYFLRFEITENGLECIAAKSAVDKEESNYIKLPHVFGDIETEGQYFGVWFAEGGTVTGKLTHVHCYDEKGNDLGVYGNTAEGVVSLKAGEMQENKAINHSYSFSLKDAETVAISNLRHTQAQEVYLEYTVNGVQKSNITQSGVILTNSPTAVYPHGDGSGQLLYMPHEQAEECKLLDEGASYLYRFTKDHAGYEVLVKRTVGGVTDYFSFPHEFGVFDEANGYYSIWFGEHCSVTADFSNVKCYDSEGNNLAIQTNQGVEITHYGNLEDYSECEAVYYCKENQTFIALDDECNASRRVDSEQVSVNGTYAIREAVLSLTISGKTEIFDYVYSALTDESGNRYIRLRDSKVTLVSGILDGEVIETVDVTAKDGYKLMRPEEPTKEGRKFQCWKLGDGTEYDFDSVVMESMTLYATWDGEDSYLATGIIGAVRNLTPVFIIVACCALIAVTGVVVVKISRRNKNEEIKENE